MDKIAMIRVYNSNLKIYVFTLLINILFVIIKPPSSLAQNSQLQPATKLSEQSHPTATNTSQTALEPEILSEINRVRTDPQGYAQWLEEQRQYYDGVLLKLPGEKPIRINKGIESLEEAIAFLKQQEPLPALSTSEANAIAATTQLKTFATEANNNIDNITYGRVTAKGIVMGLVVDDGFPDRRHRMNLLNPDIETTGVVCQDDQRYNNICAIAYDQSEANVAESKPESPDKDVPEPNQENSPTSEPESAAVAETLPQPSQPTAPPNPEIILESTAAKPEIETPQVEREESEDIKVSEPETDMSDVDDLEDVKEFESEDVEVSEPEADISNPDDQEESADNQEREVPLVSPPDSGSRLLEKAEQGVLETGDSTIPEDGSFYDSYPLEGNAGDSFTISLESDEFDAFVALIDSKGNIIEQNDDINDQESNSRIRVTIPNNGVYNVIVNAYDQGGKGKYVLTVTR